MADQLFVRRTTMRRMWVLVLVVVPACLAALHPTSPCPSVFTYEGAHPEKERWYGIVLLTTDESLLGVRIDVKLDRPAEILVSWMGTVTTNDNELFTILSLEQKLQPGPPIPSRFMVKFNAVKGSPQVRTIRLNGKQICPPDPNFLTDVQSNGQDHLYDNRYTTERATRRPDLDFDDDWTNPRPMTPRPSGNSYKPPVRESSGEREQEYSGHGSGRPNSDTHSTGTRLDKGNGHNNTQHRKPSISGSGYHSNSSRPSSTFNREQEPSDVQPRPLLTHNTDYRGPSRPSISININKDVTLNVDRPDSSGYNFGNEDTSGKEPDRPNNQYPRATEKNHEQSNPARDDFYSRTTTTTKKPIVINSINININSGDTDIPSEVSTYKPPTRRPYVNNNKSSSSSNSIRQSTQRPSSISGHENNRPNKNKDTSSSETNFQPGFGQVGYEDKTEKPYYNNQGSSNEQTNRRPSDSSRPNPTSPPSRPNGGGGGNKRTLKPQTTGSKEGEEVSNTNVKCGSVVVNPSPTPLITHGQNTARGQWPWHIALYRIEGINLSYSCGGSLISSTVVVTAAHCVTKAPRDRPVDADILVVQLGKYHLYQFSDDSVQNKQVQNVYVHPRYNSTNYLDDLAVLIISSPAEFTKYVRPVCLWPKSNFNLQSIDNKEGTVVGWGYDENNQVTEELKMARMPVVSYVTCLKSYPQFFSQFTAENKTFCAGFRQGTSVCNGDSGGGMVFQQNNMWYLRGLVSITVAKQGLRVCDTNHYVVFTDVANYVDWINQYVS